MANLPNPFNILINMALYLRYPKNIRRFYRRVGYFPNIARPEKYHEKMLWRKIFDHNPQFVRFSDKLICKEIWAKSGIDLLIPQTMWIGNHSQDIPIDLINDQYILKANHGCKFNYFFSNQDIHSDLEPYAAKWLNTSYYGKKNIEWSYSQVVPKLFVEKKIISDHMAPFYMQVKLRFIRQPG